MPLRRPADDSRAISQAALMGLAKIYSPGYRYAKAGVMLLALQDADQVQHELQLEDEVAAQRTARSPHLMSMLDAVNKRYGRGSVHLASAGVCGEQRSWAMKQERKTPGYTTCWDDMPIVRA